MDSVSRLWYFLENDKTIDKYVFTLNENENREIAGNYKEFFLLLGIWDKLEFVASPTTYREVIVPALGYVHQQYFSPKILPVFDTIAENITIDPSWKTFDKIFLSRSQLSQANSLEFGFEVMDNFFEKNGYLILFPEKISLSQLIFYIRNAEVVASISGTPPHNMLFAKNGQKLQILERCAVNNDYQVLVNRIRNLQVTYVDANFPIYTVRMTGPFIMGFNDCAEKFATANGNMILPDSYYLSEKYLKRCFKNYMKSYNDFYRYQWFAEDHVLTEIDYLSEAYYASYSYFGEFLNGNKPFLWYHYFELHYWKQFIKSILKKIKLIK